jgi:hypothetical protein
MTELAKARHHPVKIGTFKPPYAGNKANGNRHTVTIIRTEEHTRCGGSSYPFSFRRASSTRL